MPAERIAFGRDLFTVDPSRAALIVVDMQNAFVAEGGTYETPKARAMVPEIERLIEFAREQRMPIVWTRSDHSAPAGGMMLRKFPTIREDRVLWPGHPSFEFYPAMTQPRDGEHQIVKHKYDAFFETDLDAVLRNQGVRTVIITGTATSVCCDSTARSAFFRDYEVVVVRDATASFDDDMHELTLKTMDLFFGRVMSVEEVLAEMREAVGQHAVAGTGPQSPAR
jgi:nicotinamidase-related amidase